MSTSLAVYDMHENLLQSAKDGPTTCAVFSVICQKHLIP